MVSAPVDKGIVVIHLQGRCCLQVFKQQKQHRLRKPNQKSKYLDRLQVKTMSHQSNTKTTSIIIAKDNSISFPYIHQNSVMYYILIDLVAACVMLYHGIMMRISTELNGEPLYIFQQECLLLDRKTNGNDNNKNSNKSDKDNNNQLDMKSCILHSVDCFIDFIDYNCEHVVIVSIIVANIIRDGEKVATTKYKIYAKFASDSEIIDLSRRVIAMETITQVLASVDSRLENIATIDENKT